MFPSMSRSYFVVFQDSQFDFLVLVLVFLGCAVILLLALFATTFQVEQDVECTLVFHTAFSECQVVV